MKTSLNIDDTPISQVQAIDVHAHFGCNDRPGKELAIRFQSADAATVVRRAKACNIGLTIASPLRGLMPRGNSNPVSANDETANLIEHQDGLMQWVIVDPRKPRTFEQAAKLLAGRKCAGIKIHPEEHVYPIKEYGEAIFSFAAEHNAVVLTHSGEANSLPGDFIPFANAHPEMKLILAHIGCDCDGNLGLQVRAIQQSRFGNVFADTSSATSIVPNLIEWAVSEVGADRVLFGTDTPLYSTAMQRARIDHAELSDADKRKILRDNAIALLGLPHDS